MIWVDLIGGGGTTGGPWFNVTTYGAKGDGATDDTASINSAIAAAGAVGGTVYFPPTGVCYKTTSLITINVRVSLLGQAGVNWFGQPEICANFGNAYILDFVSGSEGSTVVGIFFTTTAVSPASGGAIEVNAGTTIQGVEPYVFYGNSFTATYNQFLIGNANDLILARNFFTVPVNDNLLETGGIGIFLEENHMYTAPNATLELQNTSGFTVRADDYWGNKHAILVDPGASQRVTALDFRGLIDTTSSDGILIQPGVGGSVSQTKIDAAPWINAYNANTSTGGYGVNIVGQNGATVDNVRLTGRYFSNYQDGIHITTYVNNVVVENVEFNANGHNNSYNTTVTINNTAVTWVSGPTFISNAYTIFWNGNWYGVSSVTDSHDLVLASSAGTPAGNQSINIPNPGAGFHADAGASQFTVDGATCGALGGADLNVGNQFYCARLGGGGSRAFAIRHIYLTGGPQSYSVSGPYMVYFDTAATGMYELDLGGGNNDSNNFGSVTVGGVRDQVGGISASNSTSVSLASFLPTPSLDTYGWTVKALFLVTLGNSGGGQDTAAEITVLKTADGQAAFIGPNIGDLGGGHVALTGGADQSSITIINSNASTALVYRILRFKQWATM